MKKLILFLLISIPLLATAQQRSGYRASDYHYRKASLFELLPISKKDIVMLGNSITDEAEWSELLKNKHVKNRGISADKTFDVLDRLGPILDGKPKKVFLLIGVNDLGNGLSPESVIENIHKIIRRFAKESPKTHLYVQSILPVSDKIGRKERHQSKSAEIIETNIMLEALCVENGVKYIDIYSSLVGKDGMLKPEYSNDGLHLMGAGYIVWRNIIKKHIR